MTFRTRDLWHGVPLPPLEVEVDPMVGAYVRTQPISDPVPAPEPTPVEKPAKEPARDGPGAQSADPAAVPGGGDAALSKFLDAQREAAKRPSGLEGLRDRNDRLARDLALERQARAVGRTWPSAHPELHAVPKPMPSDPSIEKAER